MNSTIKTYFGAFALLVFLVGGSYGLSRYNSRDSVSPDVPRDPNAAFLEIDAVKSASVGELVTIKVTESNAVNFSWQVYPETSNFKVQTGGKEAYLTSATANEYLVIVCAAKNDTSDVRVLKIKFVNGSTIVVDTLERKIQSWASQVESPTKRDDVIKLAQNYQTIANAVQAGGLKVTDMIAATAKSNREALGVNLSYWTIFLDNLSQELKTLAEQGRLGTTDAHIEAWKLIGDSLKKYSATL